MEIFAVFRRPGPAFDLLRGVEGQQAWAEHAAFMLALAADGFVLMAGPLEGEGALLIVRADDETAIHARLDADPWTGMGLLETDRIRRWDVRIGAPA